VEKFPKLFYRFSIWLVFFISTDLLSTYLASPNLKHESNIWVGWFNLSWSGMIFFALLQGALFVIGFFLSVSFVKNRLPKWGTIWGAYLGIILFVFHFVGSVLATINNLICSFYVRELYTPLHSFASWYVGNVNINRYYLIWFGITKFIVAICCAPLVVKRLISDKRTFPTVE
jgi:hypothetical protein